MQEGFSGADGEGCGGVGVFDDPAQAVKKLDGGVAEHVAARGERAHEAAGATGVGFLEERGSDVGFQLDEGSAVGGLGTSVLFHGLGDGTRLGDFAEMPQPFEGDAVVLEE